MSIMVNRRYSHSPLSLPSNIRLLRLLPSANDVESLKGDFSEYSLQNSVKLSSPYEALSYVWGSDKKPQCISIGELDFHITQNLYVALRQLRDRDYPRIIWVDAICINQDDDEEKQNQIPLMASIYARAFRVIAWLGEAENDSSRALEVIRLAGMKSIRLPCKKSDQKVIEEILKRPWFRRIWVWRDSKFDQ
jgi:Heterokaryon incompatibility protein (HET)